jgi:hypothetical protein
MSMSITACVTHVQQARVITQVDTMLTILRDTERIWRTKCSRRSLERRGALCTLIAEMEGVTMLATAPLVLCQWVALATQRLHPHPGAASMIKSPMKRLSFEHHLSLAGSLVHELVRELQHPGLCNSGQSARDGGRKLNPN